MPGRGTPWRGVGKGTKDRIGTEEIKDESILSEDIKDGTIAEVDLDSALQAKVNAGGGGASTQIGKFVVVTPATSISVSFTPELLDGTNMSIKLVANLKLNVTDTISTRIDNRIDATYSLEGGHSNGATHTGVTTSQTDGWTTGKNVTTNEITFLEIELAGDVPAGNEATCFYKERSESGVFYGGGAFNTISTTSIASFNVKSKLGVATISAGSTFVVYKQVIA